MGAETLLTAETDLFVNLELGDENKKLDDVYILYTRVL